MKKHLALLMFLILSFSLISCGKPSNTPDSEKGEFTKEFSFLPSYKNMEFVTLEKATTGGMNRATYKVSNTTPEEFLTGYEEHLLKNGWKNTLDNKPVSINMEKENHKAIIVIPTVEKSNEITVVIFAE